MVANVIEESDVVHRQNLHLIVGLNDAISSLATKYVTKILEYSLSYLRRFGCLISQRFKGKTFTGITWQQATTSPLGLWMIHPA